MSVNMMKSTIVAPAIVDSMRYGTAALFVLLMLNSWSHHKELVVELFEQLDSTFLGFEVSTVALGRSDSVGVLVAVRDVPVFRVGVQHAWAVVTSYRLGIVVRLRG